ncbi:MAG TPA: methyltransferase domain-containing protein [Solirubrobacterales bacterium]|nr:methyltransferase domain-containing protein [Solirubrobacterales bacterium]
MAGATYDRIGIGYSDVRRPDPRIAARLEAALGNARTVLNVGAGTGSYEPADRDVTAVEPSEVMIAQRPPGAAPVVRARAEDLPFADDSFDAAMAIITVHHWDDPAAGLAEMTRVARDRVVVLTFDPPPLREHWLLDYVPRLYEAHVEMVGSIEKVTDALPGARVEPVPMPRLCEDAFWCALWDRPEWHLDPEVRRASSGWHRIGPEEAERGLAALRADLESGAWDERWGHLRAAPEFDVGLRLVVLHATENGLQL